MIERLPIFFHSSALRVKFYTYYCGIWPLNDITSVSIILKAMIPEDWDKVLLYAEMREGYGQVFFYFYPLNSNNPVYSLDIVDMYEVDSRNYRSLKNQLYDCCEALWKEFQEQVLEQWNNFTYILWNTGEMKRHYNYVDLSLLDPTTKRERWEEKYLALP